MLEPWPLKSVASVLPRVLQIKAVACGARVIGVHLCSDGGRMTVSMRVMSAGDGYRYLLKSVVAADGDRALSTPLTRYYLEEGTPPGRWLGAGLSGFGRGDLKVGARVSEEQLQRLVGQGRDPLTGAPLGRAYPQYEPATTTADDAVAPSEAGSVEGRWTRRAVAGYDFTVSVPKSASVLWAVGDADLQDAIVGAHHAAVADVLAFMERELAATRVGVAAGDGAVAQVPVLGLSATAFDHFDSRAGDPHLHTHVVISNKVRAVLDGRWRSLDGRPLHAATVALSELHEALFADRITRLLGLQWEARERGRERNAAWAIAAVPERLVQEFSSRSREIDLEKDRLVDVYVQEHGRQPSAATVIRLRQQATLATRPEKHVRSLADLTTEWRSRATGVLAADVTNWAARLVDESTSPVTHAEQPTEAGIVALAQRVVERVGERRSTWRRWNLYAEAARQTMHQRFASTAEREAAVAAIVDRAERESVRLTPPEISALPLEFMRPDGSSVFRPKDTTVFTSPAVLAAEDRLLALAADDTGPTASLPMSGRMDRSRSGPDAEQFAAVTALVGSRSVVDLLVGPAGTGKTRTMSGLRHLWEAAHGSGSVVGLAPSAAAAQILGDELGIPTENTAMWLRLAEHGQATFEAGQLVILDEASLAGTAVLDRLATKAKEAGAKLLLVGDTDQLSAIEAGGAFAMLAGARGDALVELGGVRRFGAAWERAASLQLRNGDPEVLGTYVEHGRVVGGDADAVLESAYEAWRRDVQHGRSSVLIAGDAATVTGLNERARADLILAGRVQAAAGVELHDHTFASGGDVIVTRRNDRRLRTRRGWVRNGARWRVRAVRADGSLLVQALGTRRGGRVLLPASYVREHVELGYAVSPYRVQGLTADTGHVVVNSGTTREQLYVGMTRGRLTNTAHVALDHSDDAHSTRHPADEPITSARAVLAGVLQHLGAEPSAHEAIAHEQERWGSIAQLAAEYETIAAAAQRPRWSALVRSSGLSAHYAEAVIASDGFGALCGSLRRAEALGHNTGALLARVVRLRDLDDARDPAAVLNARLERAASTIVGAPRPVHLIAGLIPPVLGATTAEMDVALKDRQTQIQQRAEALLDAAIDSCDPWVAFISAGDPVLVRDDPTWRSHAVTVAAFRDRYATSSRDGDSNQYPGSCASSSDAMSVEQASVAALARSQRLLQVPTTYRARSMVPVPAKVSGPARR